MKGMMGWTEFDMKMKDDFIYFSGITHDADTCFAFIKQLRQQQSVKGFPGEALPSTAFYLADRGLRTGRLYFLMEMRRSRTGQSARVKCRIEIRNFPAI